VSTELPTWADQMEALKEIGDLLLKEAERDDTDARRQEMYRYMLGAVAYGYLTYVNMDTSKPTWVACWNQVLNYAGPNPDYAYKFTLVDSQGVYRISGYRGTTRFVEITETARDFVAGSGKPKPSPGTYDLDMLNIAEDGYFSVVLSAERPNGYDGDWWKLHPETQSLLMRQTAVDWRHEEDCRIAITRLDDAPPHTPEQMAERFSRLKDVVAGVIQMDMRLTRHYRDNHGINVCKISQLQKSNNPYPGQVYLDGAFQIEDDEALILETDLPKSCRYWQILLADNRFATVDWVNRQSSLNEAQAMIDSDGKFRAVIASRDPGVPNWLDTAGEPWGIIQMRWNHPSDAPEPQVTKVPFSEVRGRLPADTPVVTRAERRERLLRRNEEAQFRRLW
jgi:hypothetical protein